MSDSNILQVISKLTLFCKCHMVVFSHRISLYVGAVFLSMILDAFSSIKCVLF